jgi:membrane protein required for colicin V production
MNPFDMVIIVILGYCMIRGIFRGLIKEVFAALGVLAGIYIAYFYHETLTLILSEWMTKTVYLQMISFVILFCLVFLMITVVGMLIRLIINIALLGVMDRIFGAVFGALKAILIISFVYALLVTFLPQGGVSVVNGSKLAPQINAIAGGIVRVIPKNTKDVFNNKLNKLKKDWNRKP